MARAKCAPLRLAREHRTLRIRLTRPERYNALDLATLQALHEVLEKPVPMPLVIEGDAGIFSVGADIAELASFSGEQAAAFSRLAHAVIAKLEAWPAPTVALLEGYCLGAALELALGCDVLVGTSELRLGMPGLAWAMVPCAGGLRRLARRVPPDTTSRLFLNGEVIDGTEAVRLQLLDRLLEDPAPLVLLTHELGLWTPSAVAAVRSIRLERQGREDAAADAALFAQPFASGECQRRLKQLLAG